MITRRYTIPYDWAMSTAHCKGWIATKHLYVFIFVCGPYREEASLHPYHKRRRVWAISNDYGVGVKAGSRRTRQIERFCKLAHLACDKE